MASAARAPEAAARAATEAKRIVLIFILNGPNRFGMRGTLQGVPPRSGRRIRPHGSHIGIHKCHRGKILAKIRITMSLSWRNCGQKNTAARQAAPGDQLAAANFGTSISKLPLKWNGILTATPEPEEPLFHYTTDLIVFRHKHGGFPNADTTAHPAHRRRGHGRQLRNREHRSCIRGSDAS
ncbi:hypothetical protein CUJ84_pRLN2000353 (plasmid) [Rhizobium leguminosarum]|uniref:Uncharacterized protein n=1 Tax=Rhizobium leguminosarum TaxID=384 RepID=A0A2K9ZFS9_RHILE|nr:hypothetical protein CUJ84_pRLN2000353 [Rhizobium leguminosarum]